MGSNRMCSKQHVVTQQLTWKCVAHLALMRVCGTPEQLSNGSTHPLDNLLPDLPTKPPYAGFNCRTYFKVELGKAPFCPQGFEGLLTVRPPTTFHDTRRVPPLSHQIVDEFLSVVLASLILRPDCLLNLFLNFHIAHMS